MVLATRTTSAFTPSHAHIITAVYEATADGLGADAVASAVARIAQERGLDLAELSLDVLSVLRNAVHAAAADVRDAHAGLQRLHQAEQDARHRLLVCHAQADAGGVEQIEAELHVLAADIALSREELGESVLEQHDLLDAMTVVSSLAASAVTVPVRRRAAA